MPPKRTLIQIYGDRRMAALVGLGFGSGLPLMLTSRTLTVWARDKGVDLSTVGLFSLVATPYALKFLWAPFMDRFVPPLLGRRRGWILIAQSLLIVAIAAMAFTGPTGPNESLTPFAVAAVAVAFLSASQDIVADAYRTDVLKLDEFGVGASVFQTGYRVAMLASGAGAVYLAGSMPWKSVYLIAAGGMSIGLISTFLAPEPAEAIHSPPSFADAVVMPIEEFVYRNRWRSVLVLLFIVVFKLPDYMATKMTDPLLLDLGFTKKQIAFWALGAGVAVTIPGVLVGGAVLGRLGLIRGLFVIGIAQALSNAGYLLLADRGAIQGLMITVIGIEFFCAGLVAAGFVAFLMSQCDKRYSATQYALLSSLMGLSSSIAGAPTGYLVEWVGYKWFFVITILAGIPGVAMLPWLPVRAEAVEGSDDELKLV